MNFFIKHPHISEKSTTLGSTGTYVFLVEKNATKPAVRQAIKSLYNVDAEAVRMVNVKPKKRRLGRTEGTKPGYKKAYVTLREGQSLDILPH
jgi:large subunit ribosomal protein L23